MAKYKVEKECGLLEFLTEKYADSSASHVKRLLKNVVFVDGRRQSQYNFVLKKGMEVEVGRLGEYGKRRRRELDIVYEDRWLVVINKFEGILSNSPDKRMKTTISVLNDYFASTHQRCNAHIVHRLDRDTSGLMIVAKSKEVSRAFEENWKERVFDRRYRAVVWGKVEKREGTIRSWFTDGEYCVLSSPTDNGGKEAITHYEVLRYSRRYTLLELKLDTGRRNQIRVHMKDIKHPVVHDPMYGYEEDISPINRLALHAYRLCFTHPITGKRLEFEKEMPVSMEKLLEI